MNEWKAVTKPNQWFWTGILIASLLVLPVSAMGGVGFKSLDLPVSAFPESSHYTLVNVSEISGAPGFLSFHVSSPHAEYDVETVMALRKLIHEIEVIERIKAGKEDNGFVDGAVDSVKATGEGFKKLVTEPLDSAKDVGSAVGKLGKSVGGLFRKKEEGEKSSFGEKVLGGAKREVAAEMGVDVYTTNPYLAELLDRMARARTGGKGVAFIGKLLLPVAGLVSVTLTASGLNAAADQYVNNTSRGDLYRDNRNKFKEMGFSEKESTQMLNSEFFSPRESTYLRFYLEALKAITGFEEIFKKARKADSFLQAHKILYEAQLTADLVKDRGGQFTVLNVLPEGITLTGQDSVWLIVAYDYLEMDRLGQSVMQRIQDVRKDHGNVPAYLLSGGKVTSGLEMFARARNIQIKQWRYFSAG